MSAKKSPDKPAVKVKGSKGKVGDGVPGPGRPKGVPNKITADVQTMVLEALNRAGANVQKKRRSLAELEPGTAYLLEQAEKRPELFMPMVRQLMPAKIDIDVKMMGEELLTLMTQRRDQLAAMKDITPTKEIKK